jgi:putative sigma-54 modulation protein
MKTTITSRHFRASDKLKGHAEMEVARLDKYFDSILDCEVILSFDVHQHKTVEVAIHVPGEKMVAEETREDFYQAIDAAVAKLEKQVQRFKDKLKKKH